MPKKKLDIDNLPKPWTLRQFLFAKAYLADPARNAKKAAISAGYEKDSAHNHAHRMIKHDEFAHIQDYIKKELGGVINKYDVSKESLVQRLAVLAYGTLSGAVEVKDGKMVLLDLEKIPEASRNAIKSITQKSGAVDEIGVQLHDPIAAIRELAKINKLYEDLGDKDVRNVHIYLPDNGRDDPAHRKKDEKEEENND